MSGDVELRRRKLKTKKIELIQKAPNEEKSKVLWFFLLLFIVGVFVYKNDKWGNVLVRFGYIMDKIVEEIKNDDLGENDVEIFGSIQLENVNNAQRYIEQKPKFLIQKNNKNKKSNPQLEDAELQLTKNTKIGLEIFQKLVQEYPDDIEIRYGYAKALDKRSEEKRSNNLLQKGIKEYLTVLQTSGISDDLYLEVALRCILRMRFIGHYKDLLTFHVKSIKRLTDNLKLRNEYAVTLLTVNKLNNAKNILEETLQLWPESGYAQVLFGFILKTWDNDLVSAVKYLTLGIKSKEDGVMDGRFFYHLGDALIRLGKLREADAVHEEGARNGLFLSKHQRSLYNVERLTGRPFWKKNQLIPYGSFFRTLEDNWQIIRKEGLALLNKEGYFKNDPENLKDSGQWKQLELFSRGIQMKENCKRCPATCKIIEMFPDVKDCRRGQVKFSVMHEGTHVWPHCGPTNCRVRSHLGLKVPKKTYLRVVNQIRSWKEGEVLIFDDSFEHEVWHNGSDIRLVLIVDVWHPELTQQEKSSLPSI